MTDNYIPLYRKYRPQTIDSLVGQEHIKKTLTGAIELGKISHAYLFTGPRGTGKTSTARILAKSLNCKNGPTVHPCGECESCKDITNSIPIDVIEIDAASNRKVGDAHNILEKIQYAPVNGKYKIYIIDEVHMLTSEAFNALLKTLEEPPENVIFILATTEVHKVLDTIKSRCQRFDFRRITTEDIVKHLREISKKEKIKISDDALFAIAKNSAGGMRDSISLLDQLSILGISKEITVDDVNSILGRISFDSLNKITTEIINSLHSNAIKLLNDIYNSGNEPLQILTNLSEYFKNLLVAKTCSNELIPELTGLNESQIEELCKQVQNLELQQIIFLVERISHYIQEVKQSTNQHLWLEVGIIDLSNMTENTTLMNLQNRICELEAGKSSSEVHTKSQVITNPARVQPTKPEQISEQHVAHTKTVLEEDFTPPPIAKKADDNDTNSLWQNLLANINIKSPSTQAILRLATPVEISANNIILTFTNEMNVTRANEPNKKQLIADAAKALFNVSDISITIKVADKSDTITDSAPKSISCTEQNKTILTQKTNQSEEILDIETQKEPNVKLQRSEIRSETDQGKMVIDLFDGKYVE